MTENEKQHIALDFIRGLRARNAMLLQTILTDDVPMLNAFFNDPAD